MAKEIDYEWKFWFWTFIIAIVILAVALLCNIFIIMGSFLAIVGFGVAIYGCYNNEDETLKVGIVAEFVGLILLILGKIIYDFLVENGLIDFAQEILKILPWIR